MGASAPHARVEAGTDAFGAGKRRQSEVRHRHGPRDRQGVEAMSYATLAKQNSASRAQKPSGSAHTVSFGLKIGEANDSFEREAHRMADEVMAAGCAKPSWSFSNLSIRSQLQRKCSCVGSGECEECKQKGTMQRDAVDSSTPSIAPPIVDEVLKSAGQPLDKATRDFFEPRFGRDFRQVRIHTDDRASLSAKSVAAHAYTVNQHVVFGAGKYAPRDSEGRRLLAHELAHTVQQRSVPLSAVPRAKLRLGATGDSFEHQADVAAERSVRGNSSAVTRMSNLSRVSESGLQREGDKFANLTIPQLRKLAKTNPEAAEALWLRYQAMSNVQLERFARNDPMAQSVYADRNVVPHDAEGQGSFSNRDIQETLERDLKRQRAASVPRRASSAVTTGIKTEGGTMGTAKTDIPGLENRTFTGRSPRAGGKVNPSSKFPPATDPAVLPQTHAHAEQHIADQLEEALKSIPREQLKGRRVWMLIEQEPCSTCAQGVTDSAETAGVLRKLSEEFPEVTFEVKNLMSSEVIVLQGGSRTNVGGTSTTSASENPPAGKGPSSASVKVATEIEVTNSVKNADGSTVSEVEYVFGKDLNQINQGAPKGAEIPTRMAVRVTQNSEGVITSVESLSGQPQALVEALARRTLAPGVAGTPVAATEGAAEGAAAAARRSALLFKGLKIGGWAAFAIMTGYQLYKATPAQRPRVATEAGGGLAGGIASTYLVCNVLLDIETAGWGLVICGFIAGGAGGYAGGKAAGAAYDEATATDLDRAIRALDGTGPNERTIFNILVGKLGTSAVCIDASFVNSYLAKIPRHLQDSEAVLLATELARFSIAPLAPSTKDQSHGLSPNQPPKKKGTECPGCHGRTQASLQPSLPLFDQKEYAAIMAAPTCSSILGSAQTALKSAVSHLPRYYRAPGDISHHPEPGDPVFTPKSSANPNALPVEPVPGGSGNCPGGGCHTPNRTESKVPLNDPKKFDPDTGRNELKKWLRSQHKPAISGNAHTVTPRAELPPPSQGFPSVEEQQGSFCPSCHGSAHKDETIPGLEDFRGGMKRELTDAERKKLIDFLGAR